MEQVVPVHAGRPRFDIAAIVRKHRRALEAEQDLTVPQRRVLSAIEVCRTPALGGHVAVCRPCGYEHEHYHSCRNRHCPKCQALAQEQWIAARAEQLLPVRHFHVVFTLPSELRSLVKFRRRELFNTFFAVANATLQELAATHLEAQLGITTVLHTWTRELHFHPHVHAIVTAGGLALDGSGWVSTSSTFLFPVKVMRELLRGKMLDELRTLQRRGAFAGFGDFEDPEGFDRLMTKLAAKDWVVYVKKPFNQIGYVLAYLGRYTHRVAISNSRLVDVTDEAVTFRTKGKGTVTVTPVEFLRRFVQHVLPDGMHKIRHCGLYAGSNAKPEGRLEQARQLLPKPDRATKPTAVPPPTYAEQLHDLTGRDISRCPHCGAPLDIVPVPAASRGPPVQHAA